MIEFIKIIFSNKEIKDKNLPFMKAAFKFSETLIIIFSFITPLFFAIYSGINESNISTERSDLESSLLSLDLEIYQNKNKIDIMDAKLYTINNRYLYFNGIDKDYVDLNKKYYESIEIERDNKNNIWTWNLSYSQDKALLFLKDEYIENIKLSNSKKKILLSNFSEDIRKERQNNNLNYIVFIWVIYILVLILVFRLWYLTYKIEYLVLQKK